jgi:hypothetical protein
LKRFGATDEALSHDEYMRITSRSMIALLSNGEAYTGVLGLRQRQPSGDDASAALREIPRLRSG